MPRKLVRPLKNRKILLYYLLEFCLTVSIFITLILLILKITILNKNYFLDKLEKSDYYHELYLDINEDFSNYIMQSGFDSSIVDNLFDENSLKKVINNNVDNFYKGKEISVDTEEVEKKLETNINNYLESNNITASDDNELKLFVNEISNIYKDRIIIHKSLSKFSSKFAKLSKLANIMMLLSIIFDIVLFIIIKKIFKKITLTIPILTSMFLLLLIYYLLFAKININNIVFWNTYISNVIKSVFIDISSKIKYISIIGITIEILKLVFIRFKKS